MINPPSETGDYTVLLYHGVHADGIDLGLRNSSGKHVARAVFAEQMECLKEVRPVVSMRQIADAHLGRAELPNGAVAVTFDDGFRNNLTQALPILEVFGIPATLYVATGYIDTGRFIWTDQLEAAFLQSDADFIDLNVGNETFRYSLANDDEQIFAYNDTRLRCKHFSNEKKDEVVNAIVERLAGNLGPEDPLSAFMTWDELRRMNASPLVDIGAHTVDHIALARVPHEDMTSQIDRSVSKLSDELSEPCTLFSYPEGQEDDFNADVIEHLMKRGFDHCPTAIDGDNNLQRTDPFHILRRMVGMEGRPFPFAEV